MCLQHPLGFLEEWEEEGGRRRGENECREENRSIDNLENVFSTFRYCTIQYCVLSCHNDIVSFFSNKQLFKSKLQLSVGFCVPKCCSELADFLIARDWDEKGHSAIYFTESKLSRRSMPRRGGQEVRLCMLSSCELYCKTPWLACDMKLILLELEAGVAKDLPLNVWLNYKK